MSEQTVTETTLQQHTQTEGKRWCRDCENYTEHDDLSRCQTCLTQNTDRCFSIRNEPVGVGDEHVHETTEIVECRNGADVQLRSTKHPKSTCWVCREHADYMIEHEQWEFDRELRSPPAK